MKQYIDLGGRMRLAYWEEGNKWHVKSDVTEDEYVSEEKFTPEIFFDNNKYRNWVDNAIKL